MMMLTLSLAYFALCILGRFRTPYFGYTSFPVFFMGWLTNELAWFHLCVQLTLVATNLLTHSLYSTSGAIALTLQAISIFWLWQMHQQSLASKSTLEEGLQHYLRQNGNSTTANKNQQKNADGDDFASENRASVSPEETEDDNSVSMQRRWLRPFHMQRPNVVKHKNIHYGDGPRHRLDIYHHQKPTRAAAPVLVFIHGGGWLVGNKEQQGLPLIYFLAAKGWTVVSINYRLSPKHRMPAPIEDAKRAIAWVKQHIHQYGGDPNFIALAGGSAGGQIATLLALDNQHRWQPGFEDVDTRVQAVVPLYAVYDFVDETRVRRDNGFRFLLRRFIMPSRFEEQPELWRSLSPLYQIHAGAPPMLILHGTNDGLVPIEEADLFANAMQRTTQNPCIYIKLEGAQHAFEIFNSIRTGYSVEAIYRFLEKTHADFLKQRSA